MLRKIKKPIYYKEVKSKQQPALSVPLTWPKAIDIVKKLVVKISDPDGHGTGFLTSTSRKSGLVSISTAAHVVEDAYDWGTPIRVSYGSSENSILLREDNREIVLDKDTDSAIVIFNGSELNFAHVGLPNRDNFLILQAGVEMGWLGYPAGIGQGPGPYFFSGHLSDIQPPMYFIDGVVIQGVSGGPVFCIVNNQPHIVGIITEYHANRNTGEALPGLSVAADVFSLCSVQDTIRFIDKADAFPRLMREKGTGIKGTRKRVPKPR
jgi:hypothetical protein